MSSCDNKNCPPTDSCNQWELTKSGDQCYIEDLVIEHLAIGGADVNVFKLLGVHEQGKLIDLTGNGTAISGGDTPGFPAPNAFDKFITEWHSLQSGPGVLASAYIGYDFGVIKLENQRNRYGIDTSIKYHITTIKIKQSADSTKRATRVRIERSDNGQQWYGVAVIDLPDNDQFNTISFKHSTHMRYWRLRPVTFNGSGGINCDFWGVQALQLFEYDGTELNNIQDKIFLENRDRDYATQSIKIKGFYDLLDVQTELSRFGIELPSQTYLFQVAFSDCVARLGRPIVIGDIFELPSETQFTPDLKPIQKILEVTDVTWSTTGYTPGWVPTILRITAQPALASQETQDIFGDLSPKIDSSGLFDTDDGNNPLYQDVSTVSQEIQQQANTNLPERGRDGKGTVQQLTDSQIKQGDVVGLPNIRRIGLNGTGLYVEDAMPPNGLPYTEGETFPTTTSDGTYHRLTYVGLAKDIPPRLYRFSNLKNRWIYLESDRRAQYNQQKPVLVEFLTQPTKQPPDNIK